MGVRAQRGGRGRHIEGRKGPTPAGSKPSESVTWPDRQVQRKFGNHAADFGVISTYAPESAERFKRAMQDCIDQPATERVQGYRNGAVTIYTDPAYEK